MNIVNLDQGNKEVQSINLSDASFILTSVYICSLNLLKEVLDGIVIYFDFTLFDHLLYAPEKKQYEVIIAKKALVVTPGQQPSEDIPVECCDKVELPSQIYGVEHLLRLFGMFAYSISHDWIYKKPNLLHCAIQIQVFNIWVFFNA